MRHPVFRSRLHAGHAHWKHDFFYTGLKRTNESNISLLSKNGVKISDPRIPNSEFVPVSPGVERRFAGFLTDHGVYRYIYIPYQNQAK